MATRLLAGDLVVLRVRWNALAGQLGLVVGQDGEDWLVLWTTGDRAAKFSWHLADALLVIDDTNLAAVRQRCNLAG